jgi:hypothetical protein
LERVQSVDGPSPGPEANDVTAALLEALALEDDERE